MMRSTSSPAIWPASLVAWRCESSKYAGTVTTAWSTVSPRYASASRFSLPRICAEISCGVHFLPSTSGPQSFSPMCRFTDRTVRSGFVMAWRLATSPTRISPFLANPTTDGVVRAPSAFGMTTGSPASSTETTEFVVPRSIPTARAIELPPSLGRSSVAHEYRTLSALVSTSCLPGVFLAPRRSPSRSRRRPLGRAGGPERRGGVCSRRCSCVPASSPCSWWSPGAWPPGEPGCSPVSCGSAARSSGAATSRAGSRVKASRSSANASSSNARSPA